MKQPDRFEQAVLKVAKGPPHYKTVHLVEAVKLLKTYHAQVVRVVKAQEWIVYGRGPMINRAALLAALATRRGRR